MQVAWMSLSWLHVTVSPLDNVSAFDTGIVTPTVTPPAVTAIPNTASIRFLFMSYPLCFPIFRFDSRTGLTGFTAPHWLTLEELAEL
jgi:hypothetical protein